MNIFSLIGAVRFEDPIHQQVDFLECSICGAAVVNSSKHLDFHNVCRECRGGLHQFCLAMAMGATGDECSCPCYPGARGPARA